MSRYVDDIALSAIWQWHRVEIILDQGVVDRLRREAVEVGTTVLARARDLIRVALDGKVGLGEIPSFIGDKSHIDVLVVTPDRYLTGLVRLCCAEGDLSLHWWLGLRWYAARGRCQVVNGLRQHKGGTSDPGDGVDNKELARDPIVAVESSVVAKGELTPAAAELGQHTGR